jgi:hypothetical protein
MVRPDTGLPSLLRYVQLFTIDVASTNVYRICGDTASWSLAVGGALAANDVSNMYGTIASHHVNAAGYRKNFEE